MKTAVGNRIVCITFIAVGIFFCLNGRLLYARPTPVELLEAEEKDYPEMRKPRLWPFTLLMDITEAKDDLSEKFGTKIAVLVHYANQMVLKNKHNQGKDISAWSARFEIDQKLWKGGVVELEAKGGRGRGADKLVNTLSKFDKCMGKPASLFISRFCLSQRLFDEKLRLNGGRIKPSSYFDKNTVANSGDSQFMSLALVNNLTIPFSSAGLGLHAQAVPYSWLYLRYGVANADSRQTMVRLEHGFAHTLNMAEFGLTPKIDDLQGNYRFIYWNRRKGIERIDGQGSKDGDYGFAVSFDQQLTHKASAFFRYGHDDRKVRKIENFWSIGIEAEGLMPSRKLDIAAIGVAQSIAGRDYVKAHQLVRPETMIEMYYKIIVNRYLFVTPDLQVVVHPEMDKKQGTAIVLSARMLVLF